MTAIRELHNEHSNKSAKHVEIQLPDGMTYQAGDHLEIFPQNDPILVESVAIGFGLVLDACFEVGSLSLQELFILQQNKCWA